MSKREGSVIITAQPARLFSGFARIELTSAVAATVLTAIGFALDVKVLDFIGIVGTAFSCGLLVARTLLRPE